MIARLKAAAAGWVEDQAGQMGAALAYYTLFSLAPLLILAVAVLGEVLGREDSKQQLLTHIGTLIDAESAAAVGVLLDNFRAPGAASRAGLSIVGVASLLFGATGMFTSLRSSLARIWRLPDTDGVVGGFFKSYLVAALMVVLSCAFFTALLLVSTTRPVVEQHFARVLAHVPWSGPLLDLAISTLLLTLLFLFSFRFLSYRRLPYRRLVGGAFVTAVLFSVGKIAIGYYLAFVGLGSAYGASGSIVVLLAWVYYSAQIVFFGAEVVRAGLPEEPT